MPLSIAIVVGSLRRESYNRRLAEGLTRLPAAAGCDFTFADIGGLPLYNQDDDANQPLSARHFKEQIRAADAVIFVTPEYNRSMPGVLKNALDHASRPFGESAWPGKPAGIIGVSPGAMGTALAQQHLRNVLASLDMPTLGQPEAFFHWSEALIGPDGMIAGKSAEHLTKWMVAFLAHVRCHSAG